MDFVTMRLAGILDKEKEVRYYTNVIHITPDEIDNAVKYSTPGVSNPSRIDFNMPFVFEYQWIEEDEGIIYRNMGFLRSGSDALWEFVTALCQYIENTYIKQPVYIKLDDIIESAEKYKTGESIKILISYNKSLRDLNE